MVGIVTKIDLIDFSPSVRSKRRKAPVNVGVNDGAAPTHARYVVIGLTLSLVAVAYLDRVCISTAAPIIRAELGLDQAQMGMVFSAFTVTYGLFEMPSGWLADRFGAKRALTRIVIFWSAMTAATGLVTGFGSLIVVRLLFGMGEAGAFPRPRARTYGGSPKRSGAERSARPS